MKRSVQHFSDEYLKQCQEMTAEQIVIFLDQFRRLHGKQSTKKRLISMRISEDLLAAAKFKAKALGVRYQSAIQRLIEEWVVG